MHTLLIIEVITPLEAISEVIEVVAEDEDGVKIVETEEEILSKITEIDGTIDKLSSARIDGVVNRTEAADLRLPKEEHARLRIHSVRVAIPHQI